MNNKYLIEDLRDFREWAESNIYEVPIDLPDVLSRAADVIENMEKLIEVLQQEMETYRQREERARSILFPPSPADLYQGGELT